jgi:hypothetical protein
MKKIRLKEKIMVCPFCQYKMDSLSEIALRKEGAAMDIGDIAVCMNCGQPNIVSETYELRAMTPEEKTTLQQEDPEAFFTMMRASFRVTSFSKNN